MSRWGGRKKSWKPTPEKTVLLPPFLLQEYRVPSTSWMTMSSHPTLIEAVAKAESVRQSASKTLRILDQNETVLLKLGTCIEAKIKHQQR